ncbi:MAG: hypothetical protein KatS3mg087_2005 [Patescibacteria group bacterium]|nr:MAG: hypothetical protein KatS3mg087_2005 [Patescibacteria group bacterium]
MFLKEKKITCKIITILTKINLYFFIPYFLFIGTIGLAHYLLLYVVGYVGVDWIDKVNLVLIPLNLFIIFTYWIYALRFEFNGCFLRIMGIIGGLWSMFWAILYMILQVYSICECNKLMKSEACKNINNENDKVKLYINCIFFGGMFIVNSRDKCISNLENSCEKCKEMNKTYYHEETAIIILDSLKKR